MFRREIKKQFNENKYNLLTAKGIYAQTHQQKRPFQKAVAGSLCLGILGFNVTKRYYTFPHFHKDTTKPLTLANGELHPFEKQPAVSNDIRNYAMLIYLCLLVCRRHAYAQQARETVLSKQSFKRTEKQIVRCKNRHSLTH